MPLFTAKVSHHFEIVDKSRLLLCSVLVAFGCTLSSAGAWAKEKNGWYFVGKGGPSFSSLSDVKSANSGETLKVNNGSNIVGAFGMAAGYEMMYKHEVPLRVELEFMNRTEVTYNASPLTTSATSGSLSSTAQNIAMMVNGYWHFPVNSKIWWPFVSGGLGWSHTKTKSLYTPNGSNTGTAYTKSADNLAWSVGVGASMKMGPDMTNDIELRHVSLGANDWGLPSQNIKTDSFSATELIFGIRYNF